MNEKGRSTVRELVIHRSVNCDLVHLHQNMGTLTRQDAVVKKLLKQVMTLSFQRILHLDCCYFLPGNFALASLWNNKEEARAKIYREWSSAQYKQKEHNKRNKERK